MHKHLTFIPVYTMTSADYSVDFDPPTLIRPICRAVTSQGALVDSHAEFLMEMTRV